MHSAPEWHVEVNDTAFEVLTNDYQNLCKGFRPPVTAPGASFYLMKVFWQRRRLDLVMWDTAGEDYSRFVEIEQYSKYAYWTEMIPYCKSVMVAILCERIRGTTGREDSFDEDKFLSRLFRKICQSRNYLRQVVVLLIGTDIYGDIPSQVNREATEGFEHMYRIFPGFLKNAGIKVDVVPLSNIGLGNALDSKTWNLSKPPKPYNILEPLKYIYPVYRPWWEQWTLRLRAKTRSEQLVEANETNSVFHDQTVNDASLETVSLSELRHQLRQVLDLRFNESELRTLCFDLDIDYEDLAGEGKADKARELVSYYERRDCIRMLAQAVSQRRPNIIKDTQK